MQSTKQKLSREDKIEIEVLRVAKYVVGVPRLFVILFIRQFEEERATKTHKYSDILPIPKTPTLTSIHSAKNLRKLNVGLDSNAKLLPVPSGNPMFMFSIWGR